MIADLQKKKIMLRSGGLSIEPESTDMRQYLTKRNVYFFSIFLGMLVSTGFLLYFEIDTGEIRKLSLNIKNVGEVSGGVLFLLFPWLWLLLAVFFNKKTGVFFSITNYMVVAISAWLFYEMLVSQKDHSRVFVFAIVWGIQMLYVVFVIFVRHIMARRKTALVLRQ